MQTLAGIHNQTFYILQVISSFHYNSLFSAHHRHRSHKHRGGRTTKQPNIVFILADDLGFNDVPWHNPTIIAPHLSQLASTGVILEQNYVQPKCAPSRAALLTGRYPYHIGRQHESLPPSMPTGVSLKYKLLSQVRKYKIHM